MLVLHDLRLVAVGEGIALQRRGGEEVVAQQRKRNRWTAREGIAALADAASFVEYGGLVRPAMAGMEGAADGLVMGTARVEGRAANLDLIGIYSDPLIIYVYIGSIPFFVGLYQAFKVLNLIDANRAFSQGAVDTLKNMKFAALSLIGLNWAPGPWLYVPVAIAGAAYAGMQTLPMAMLPDVISHDARAHGVLGGGCTWRRAGDCQTTWHASGELLHTRHLCGRWSCDRGAPWHDRDGARPSGHGARKDGRVPRGRTGNARGAAAGRS